MERLKVVRYNGKSDSYTWCSDPSALVAGQEYTVLHERVMNWQTNYTLQGVPGEFNSVWFDPVEDSQHVKSDESHIFIAATRNVPVVGQRLKLTRYESVGGISTPNMVNTSPVKKVAPLRDNIYLIQTQSTTYVTLVLEP